MSGEGSGGENGGGSAEEQSNISREDFFVMRLSEAEIEAARGRVKRWREGRKEGILASLFL